MEQLAFVQFLFGKNRHDGREQDNAEQTHADDFSQLLRGDAPDEHHDEDGGEEQGRRGKVFRDDEGAGEAGGEEDDFHGPFVGPFLRLSKGEDECHEEDQSALGDFRRLELDTEIEPSCAVVLLCADDERQNEKEDADGIEENPELEESAGNGVNHPDNDRSDAQKDGLFEERGHEVAARVAQGTCCAVDLYEGNHAEPKINGPDDQVALKQALG